MQIEDEEGQALAAKASQINTLLLKLLPTLQAGRSSAAIQIVWDAQKHNTLLLHRLERLGWSAPAAHLTSYETELDRDQSSTEVPLRLLSSPAAQRYAAALREAAAACKEMEQERGIEDGLTEMFEDYAESAEMELFGPMGLRES